MCCGNDIQNISGVGQYQNSGTSRATCDLRELQVVVRCRPLNTKEHQDGRKTIVGMDVREGQVHVNNPKAGPEEPKKSFTYDQVYDGDSQQLELFSITAKPIVESVMAGYNGTIFAYGQTGTGTVQVCRDSLQAYPSHWM